MHPPATATMVTETDAAPPRPGWVKALGVCHIVVALLVSFLMIGMTIWVVAAATMKPIDPNSAGVMGERDPRLLWFTVIDAVSGLIANGFTFASGVALFNLKAWGARVWRWLAPAKIARLVVVWGGFIIVVAPGLATAMGRSMVAMIQAQPRSGLAKIPTAGEVSLVYAWMYLAMGIGMIVLGSIYPTASWWLARRPGLRAALVAGESGPEPVVPDPSAEARPS